MTVRKKGLWLAGVRVEWIETTKRHRSPCSSCKQPMPHIRLRLCQGQGKSGSTANLCPACAQPILEELGRELATMLDWMDSGSTDIIDMREGRTHYNALWKQLNEEYKERKALKDLAKEQKAVK